MAHSNRRMHIAKKGKKDEFYTEIQYIERELSYYKDHFKGKTVFLNCDDPETSNFWRYFKLNLAFLGIKKLIATHYDALQPTYKLEATLEDPDKPVTVDDAGNVQNVLTVRTPLEQNGDFRSPEAIEILKTSDIVVTNPPFSLFREYLAQLMEYDKKFLIIGNLNAITYKEVFKYIKEGRLWLGQNVHGSSMEFRVPDEYPLLTTNSRVDEQGNKYIKVSGVRWYTNLEIDKRNEELFLYKKYYGHEEEYPKYDNYDAIEVSKVAHIPMDYEGVMGVPITFLDKYNPEQFELLGATQRGCHDEVPDTKKYDEYWEVRQDGSTTGSSGSKTNENANLLGNDGRKNYFVNADGRVIQAVYQRLFIRNKHPQKEVTWT